MKTLRFILFFRPQQVDIKILHFHCPHVELVLIKNVLLPVIYQNFQKN